MKERPILFSGPMVRAILEGRKTQTRRVVKPGPGQKWLTERTLGEVRRFAPSQDGWWTMAVGEPSRILHCGHEMDGGHIGSVHCPYGAPGDRFWVRETWAAVYDCKELPCCENGEGTHHRLVYRATEPNGIRGVCRSFEDERDAIWRPSIHMPRWASRITLEVTGVRVERLQDISEEDAKAEGAEWHDGRGIGHSGWRHDRDHGFVYPTARESFFALWEGINGRESLTANVWTWVVEFRRVEAKQEAA